LVLHWVDSQLPVIASFMIFIFGWPCILNCICIINQHNALFFFTSLHYHTSACFRLICGPSLGGQEYSEANCTFFSSKPTIGGPGPA
jgi:hypothetical protein